MIKKLLASSLISLIISLPAYADKKIAVLPFNTPDKKEETQQFSFGTMASVIHTLRNLDDYTVIDRGQIDNVLKELGFQQTGFTDKEQIRIGKLSGVDILVFGTIQKSNNIYRINVNFTDVQSGKIIRTFQVTGSDIFELQDKLSSEILRESKLTTKDVIQTTNSKAYNLYIKAKELSKKFDKKNLDQALLIINQSIKLDSNYIQAYSARAKINAMLALLLKQSGASYLDKFSNAELDAEKVIEQDDKNIDAYIALYIAGEVEEKRDDLDDIFNKAVKINSSEFAEVLFNLASIYQRNNFKEAEYFYKKSIKADSQYIYSYNSLGLLYNKEKKRDKAIEIYKKGLEINPKYTSMKINLGTVYLLKGLFDLALKEYQALIEINPEEPIAYYSIGNIYSIKDENELAIKFFKKSIEVDKYFLTSYSALAELYLNLNKIDESYPYIQKALEIDKGDSYSNYALSLYYAKKGNSKKSIEIANKATKDLNMPKPFLIDIYLTNKMYDKAINQVKDEIKSKPDDFQNYLQLYKIYKDLKKYDLSIDNLKIAISKDMSEDKVKYWNNKLRENYLFYGIEEYKAGNYIHAIEVYNEAINISKDVSTYNNIGISYFMLKDYDKAIEQYNKALNLEPKHLDSILNLAMTYEVLGKKTEADNQYKKACQLGYKGKCN